MCESSNSGAPGVTCKFTCVFDRLKAFSLLLGPEGSILEVDASAAALPGGRALVGRNFVRNPAEFPCHDLETRAALSAGIREMLGGKRDFFTLEYSCPSIHFRRRLRLSAVRLDGGGPCSVVLTHSDVTEAQLEHEALLINKFATDKAGDAIFWVGENGRFAYANEAASRLTGFPKEALMTMGVPDLNPEIAKTGWAVEWGEIRKDGTRHVETQIRRQDGRMIPIELTATIVRLGDRELACAILRDVSERKRLEEQFYQAQKLEAVARLAGGVAHDFNNLLTVINGYSQMLLDQSTAKDSQREFYQEIYDAGRRAAGLTRRLLAFSRKEIIQPVALNLNPLLREFERMLRRLLGEDIKILMDLDPGLGRIKADPGQIEQVVMNLCVNARDAMPKGGSLVVQTVDVTLDPESARGLGNLPPGPYVRLIVADTGCGMAQPVLARLFEPFFTTKERGRGTGLGLSTVYGIVHGCGGHIAVESEVGNGTSFSLYFPLTKESAAAAAASEPRSARGRETILLLEDELPVRMVARRLLEGHGYRVFEATTGQEALDIGSDPAQSVDLLLTDVVLPGLSGVEVAQRLKSLRPSLKVLLMSGYTDRSLGEDGALPAGMGFLQKPFTLDAVTRKVREMLEASTLQEAIS